jgi:hypothetical protein
MLKKTVLAFYGGSVAKASKASGISRSAIYSWPLEEPIPPQAALKFQLATKGKLKVDPNHYRGASRQTPHALLS